MLISFLFRALLALQESSSNGHREPIHEVVYSSPRYHLLLIPASIVSPGCLIVNLLDYRPPKPNDPPLDTPKRSREVLHPTPETLWAELCVISASTAVQLAGAQGLKIEAKILLHTTSSLLDPYLHLSRIANIVRRVTNTQMDTSVS
ncbi:hypothetical protein C8R42DRAFT_69088 [Lentinula raphanica]|nr:hypothetical protein C8R42DRAFT_69088 [Lentinula raphanica]